MQQTQLILINLGPIKNIDTTLFKKVKYIEIKLLNNNYDIDLLSILNNDFIACMYLDLGTTLESIYLSNLNISPIQIAVHGNPISSFGSKINYYISGLDIEDIRSSCNNYTERLVLIPGLGLSNIYSDFTPNTLNKNDTKKYIILCPWGLHKLNYYILTLLKKIISLSKREIVFRFFLGFEYKKFNRFLPLKQELQEILGRNSIEIVTDKKYKDYLELLNEGKIGIFSYPFGGFNTAIDILSLAKPVIVYKGNKAHNKFVPTLLEKLNLNELIANNDEEYIDKILYLIHNDEYREELSCKIGKINLKESLDKINNPKYFKKAIDYLIDNHQHLMLENYKEPIIIT